MNTKAISLHELRADTKGHLWHCCDSGQTLLVELPDGRRVSIQPVDEEENLVDNLIEHNAEFRQLLAKSAASPRKPFRPKAVRESSVKPARKRKVGVASRKK